MNVLDWILVAVVLAYALSGYWQGFITGAAATVGLLLGGAVGIWVAPQVLGDASPSIWVSLGALFIVIVAASIGQAVCQYAGARLRAHIRWQPVRAVDAIGGAALSAVAVLLVAWALGLAVSGSRIDGVTSLVRSSVVLGKVDRVLPQSADGLLRTFNNVVGTTFFPRYLEPFAPETIVRVGPGPRRLLTDPDVVGAGHSVVKIHGEASCGRGIEGSGFVYAPDRLMTNAHVVAGVSQPQVIVGSRTLPARVVFYDPDLDVAVLAFDSSGLTPLRFEVRAARGDGVAVLGYPQDGPFTIATARIRAEQRLRSPDIYGQGSVVRQVFSVRGSIRQGNSGGPLVDAAGQVAGVVFAASVTDPDTGYALTAEQIGSAAAAGRGSGTTVSTGGCAS